MVNSVEDVVGRVDVFEDWIPKFKYVIVGRTKDTGIKLRVDELVIAKRDALVKLLFSKLEFLPVVKSLFGQFQNQKNDESMTLDVADLVTKLKDVIFTLLSEHLTKISCLLLDSDINREKIDNVDMNAEQEDEEFRFKYSKVMYDWIKNNITMKQEQAVIYAFMETNDIATLLKNYSTPVMRLYQKVTGD